jgi:hypothetical protein
MKTLGERMMTRQKYLKILLLLAVAVMMAVPAYSTCISNVPDRINKGESYCISVCSDVFYYPAIQLYGPYNGPAARPILTLAAGCNMATTNCDVECTPITPPNFVLGGDPFFPEQYYGHNDCFDMYFYWVHDNVWAIEIYTFCDGCFCLTYDDQLAVQMRSDLSATAGNSQVSLSWATASEANNDHFSIVRDGQNVKDLAGAGNSSTGHEYTWVDNDVQNGTTYHYTLFSVDGNGARVERGTVEATPRNGAMVTEYALYQNYPNPFNPTTSIAFDVVEANRVTLKVYNPLGEQVATLMDGAAGIGHHTVSFDGKNLTSGLYFYTITIGDRFSATRKMLLVK